MILPLYSVMQKRYHLAICAAAKLRWGPTTWTAFLGACISRIGARIGAGFDFLRVSSVRIGLYINARNCWRHHGTFISNRIALPISSSLNWGLRRLGANPLAVVLGLYWA